MMGTNYYYESLVCEHCGAVDRLHIGKQSFGWKFSFRAYIGPPNDFEISDIRDWIKLLTKKRGRITRNPRGTRQGGALDIPV